MNYENYEVTFVYCTKNITNYNFEEGVSYPLIKATDANTYLVIGKSLNNDLNILELIWDRIDNEYVIAENNNDWTNKSITFG